MAKRQNKTIPIEQVNRFGNGSLKRLTSFTSAGGAATVAIWRTGWRREQLVLAEIAGRVGEGT